MATIDTIAKTDSGYLYTFSGTGVDVWLDGHLLESNYDSTELTLDSDGYAPPEIEICDHGDRPVNAWAARRITLQWCAAGYTSYAVTEYRGGAEYDTFFVDVVPPELYVSVTVKQSASDSVIQYWTVRPAVKHDGGSYSIAGMPIQTTVRRHYLPPAPQVEYSYSAATGLITISAKRRGML